MARGYAVLDTETTGFQGNSTNRIVEIGVVLLDTNLDSEGSWESLINPQRDIGNTFVHGISATDVYRAPTFADIVPKLFELLTDRIVVCHNLAFDQAFILREYDRIGRQLDLVETGWLCSEKLARSLRASSGAYSLAYLCRQFGIEIQGAHSALGDAVATSELLKALLSLTPNLNDEILCREVQTFPDFPTSPSAAPLPRGNVGALREITFIQRLVEALPDVSSNPAEADYVKMLEAALLDLVLSESEVDLLVSTAVRSDLSSDDVDRIHREYLTNLVKLAWSDAILTDSERAEIVTVANLLGLGELDLEVALRPPSNLEGDDIAQQTGSRIKPGALFCLTGTMHPGKEETANLLRLGGFEVVETLSKKVSYLVAGDVNSSSGKAVKARSYGITVVSAEWIWQTLRP